MIKNTLENTKKATYTVLVPHPNPSYLDFPTPSGTGFFITENGYFITARHVIQKINENNVTVLSPTGIPELFDMSKISLSQPGLIYRSVEHFSLVHDFPELDLVILKADFEKNKIKDVFKNKNGFDYININFNIIEEGESVYSFGYPLAEHQVNFDQQNQPTFGTHTYYPRVTSLIISSHYDQIGFSISGGFPKYYVIDKALNYGNSGGPIVTEEKGDVISVCVRFQPVSIRQGQGVAAVTIPSLYGISVSLKNIEDFIKKLII